MKHLTGAHAALLAAVLGSLATAQRTVVSPVRLTNTEGPSQNSFPIATTALARYMGIHSDIGGSVKLITGIGFRRDGPDASPGGERELDIEIAMGDARSFDRISYVYSENWLGTPSTVMPRRTLRVGPCTAPGEPAPFELLLPLPVPYFYLGVNSLGYDMRIHASVQIGVLKLLDAVSTTRVDGSTPLTGDGCFATGQAAAMDLVMSHHDVTGTYMIGGLIRFAPPNAQTFLALGASNPDLQFPGLCGRLLTDLLVTWNCGPSDAAGIVGEPGPVPGVVYPSANMYWTMPNTFPGVTLYAQAHALDVHRSDPLKICNSRGLKLTVPVPDTGSAVRCSRLYSFATTATEYPRAAPVGSNVGTAPATEFRF